MVVWLWAFLLASLGEMIAKGGHRGAAYGLETGAFGSYIRSLIGLKSSKDSVDESQRYRYRSYAVHLDLLQELESKCSSIMRIHRHTSKSGLYCGESKCQYLHIRLGSLSDHNEAPNVLFVSGIHGDEKLGVEITTEFVSSICDQYVNQKNLGIRYLLSTRNIWVVPMANPWGFYHNKRTEREVDINRDFPSMSAENCLRSESTRMLYDLFNLNQFVFVAALHGGLRSISYGNGYYDHHGDGGDDDNYRIFEYIARDLQVSAGKVLGGDGKANQLVYFYDQIGIISQTVYPVKGGFEDWSLFGYRLGHIPCSDYIQKSHSANQGGSLTFLIETDHQKVPEEDSLGSRSDIFSLIDLDKLTTQPSHITRNIRMLLKLSEYTYPDVIFFNKPPDTVYFGQTFVLYLAIIGCYSFNNLRLKLETDGPPPSLGTEKQPIYLEFSVNEGLDGPQSTIYYRRCSSIFLNNREIGDVLGNDSLYSSKDKCSDSSLLTKIVNRSFRVKNKCKSIYQFNKFKPIRLLVKVPYETKILGSVEGELEHFRLKAELSFDLELTQSLPYSNPNLFERFVQLRSSQNGRSVDRPLIVSRPDEDLPANLSSPSSLHGFKIKVTRPQEILQIEFSNCLEDLVLAQTGSKWTRSCLAVTEFTRQAALTRGDVSPLSRIMQYIDSNNIGTFEHRRVFLGNLKLIGEKLRADLQGNLYVIPSDPRTPVPSRGARKGREREEGWVSSTPSLLEESEDETSPALPYFNNITLELAVSVSNEPKGTGEYVILKFAEFLNLLNTDISGYRNVEEALLGPNGGLRSVGIISVYDLLQDQNKETPPFQKIRSISRQRIFEMVTEIQTPEGFSQLSQENDPNLLSKYYVILRYLKNQLVSMALGRAHVDNYIKNSLGTRVQELQNFRMPDANSDYHIHGYPGTYENKVKGTEEPVAASLRNKLQSWWFNNSKDYMDFRLVLVFSGLFMLVFAAILASIKVFKYLNYRTPLTSLRLEFKKRFRTNSKMFIIDISSQEDSDREKTHSKRRRMKRVKSRKISVSHQDACYTPRSDYKPNKSCYTLSQRFNTNNSESNDKPRDSPANSLNHSISSFDHFKSRSNTMKELEAIEMERNLDIGMFLPTAKDGNKTSPKNAYYTELSTSISKANAKTTLNSSPNH